MIGDNIRKRREEIGMSSTNLAKSVQVSQPMISQIERGTKTVSLPLAVEIARVLECEIQELLDEQTRETEDDNKKI